MLPSPITTTSTIHLILNISTNSNKWASHHPTDTRNQRWSIRASRAAAKEPKRKNSNNSLTKEQPSEIRKRLNRSISKVRPKLRPGRTTASVTTMKPQHQNSSFKKSQRKPLEKLFNRRRVRQKLNREANS